MAEPVSCFRNIVVCGKVGLGATIANALIKEQIFDIEQPNVSVYDIPATNESKSRKIGDIVYKLQIIDTYAEGKSTVISAEDVRKIKDVCTRNLSEGINLIVFALSFDDIVREEVAAFTTIIKYMQQTAVNEIATVVLDVPPKYIDENNKFKRESAYRDGEKTRDVATCVSNLLVITLANEEDCESKSKSERYKQKYEASIRDLEVLVNSSKEMWLATELFNIPLDAQCQQNRVAKQPSFIDKLIQQF